MRGNSLGHHVTRVDFYSVMSSGLTIVTANDDDAPVRDSAKLDAVMFADVDDPIRLFDIHRRRVERAIAAGEAPVHIDWHAHATHPVALLQQLFDDAIDDGVRRGVVEPATAVNVRYTRKGAALAAWSFQWPLPEIRRRRQRRRAREVLRTLGM